MGDTRCVADLDIVPLDPETWPSLAELFEQGSDPAHCWCTFWRFTNAESAGMSEADNRAWLQATAASDPPAGLVAIRDGAAVGWVGLAPREEFNRLHRSRTIPMIDGDAVWSITCFVIGRAARRQGLASDLLSAAIELAAECGAGVLEAYPVAPAPGKRMPSASGYTGFESTFLAAGFARVSETSSSAGGAPRVVVRRDLQ
jgi:GNAT superfamily N-acetyltransferase